MSRYWNIIRNRKRLITMLIAVCFTVSYLPVADHWLVSFKNRATLAPLVTSAMAVKKYFGIKDNPEKLAGSLSSVFKELKIATGQIKLKATQKKGPVFLTEIIPEYPLLKCILLPYITSGAGELIPDENFFYQSIILSPDPRPPENYSFICFSYSALS